MAFHNDSALGGIHIVHNWEYADATARTGATGFAAGDVGKVAWQLDNNSFWVLATTAPTWVSLGGGSVSAHAATHTNGTDDVQTATAVQKGLMSAAAMSKLDGIETAADVTDATNVTAAGAVMASTATTKGDLLVATASATVTRLGVGTNTHVLTADSGEASGVKWAAVSAGSSFPLFTPRLLFPDTSDWAVNAYAAAALDSATTHIAVRRFDDSTNEGVGFVAHVPSGATNIIINMWSRAQTAPGTAKTVAWGLYRREIPNNSAIGAWSSLYDQTPVDIPTNAYWQADSFTIALSSLGLTAGNEYVFELIRKATDGTYDTLVGDWVLSEHLEVGWS